MYGPEPEGRWSKLIGGGDVFQGLRAGKRYVVIQAFTDYDRDAHPVGESWVYLGHAFNIHEDGLSLFVSLDGRQEWMIRLQWLPESQAEIIDHLSDRYVRPAP